MGKNIGKNLSKNLSGKYSQKLLDHAKISATDAPKISSFKVTQKNAEGTGELIGKKIANKITKLSKNSQQNNSVTVTNENDNKIPKKIYVSPKEIQEIIDELRLKQFRKNYK